MQLCARQITSPARVRQREANKKGIGEKERGKKYAQHKPYEMLRMCERVELFTPMILTAYHQLEEGTRSTIFFCSAFFVCVCVSVNGIIMNRINKLS